MCFWVCISVLTQLTSIYYEIFPRCDIRWTFFVYSLFFSHLSIQWGLNFAGSAWGGRGGPLTSTWGSVLHLPTAELSSWRMCQAAERSPRVTVHSPTYVRCAQSQPALICEENREPNCTKQCSCCRVVLLPPHKWGLRRSQKGQNSRWHRITVIIASRLISW